MTRCRMKKRLRAFVPQSVYSDAVIKGATLATLYYSLFPIGLFVQSLRVSLTMLLCYYIADYGIVHIGTTVGRCLHINRRGPLA